MKKTIYIIIGIVIGLVVLGFAYWTISPLFTSEYLDEAVPEAISETRTESEELPLNTEETDEDDMAQGIAVGEPNPNSPDKEPVESTVSTFPAEIKGTSGHPASGTVRVVDTGTEKFLRYENFKTINGPDIFVYLAKDIDANEYIDLGKVKATEGNINYSIPNNVDPQEYPYALVWCRAFGVLFNSAKLY
jgi:hypothetical protein